MPKDPKESKEAAEGFTGFLLKAIPRLNWPATLVIVAALAFYGIFLAPNYITSEDLAKEIQKYHPKVDIHLAVHDTVIDAISTQRMQDVEDLRADLREIRSRHP